MKSVTEAVHLGECKRKRPRIAPAADAPVNLPQASPRPDAVSAELDSSDQSTSANLDRACQPPASAISPVSALDLACHRATCIIRLRAARPFCLRNSSCAGWIFLFEAIPTSGLETCVRTSTFFPKIVGLSRHFQQATLLDIEGPRRAS